MGHKRWFRRSAACRQGDMQDGGALWRHRCWIFRAVFSVALLVGTLFLLLFSSPLLREAAGQSAAGHEGMADQRSDGRLPSAPYPGVYAFYDNQNLDPQSYPIVGGNYIFNWSDLEPAQDEYRWDLIDDWVTGQASLGKPAGVSLSVHNGVCCGGDAVPAWLHAIAPNTRVVCDGERDDDWVIPRYWDETYLAHYNDFVRALAARYDGDPRIAWMAIGVGMYGETWPAEVGQSADYRNCLENEGLSSELWVGTVQRIIDIYTRAFTATPLLVQFAPEYLSWSERPLITDYAAGLGVGLKHNGLHPDSGVAIREGMGQYDPMLKWGDEVALAWESYDYLITGEAGTLWGIYNGLDKHADYMVLHYDVVTQEGRRPILEFANEYLGRTLEDTPGVWVALRETERTGAYLYPQRGNYDFWLYQLDEAPGGRSVPEWNISSYKEGRYTRRTDEATGNGYMVFDVDDGYLRDITLAPGEAVTVTVVYYDQGVDTWELQYDSTDGAYHSAGVVIKGDSGMWQRRDFVLKDARFGNRQVGGGDFRIWSRGDGDEYIHFVQVSRQSPPITPTPITPTPTYSPPATVTPTATPERSVVLQQGVGGYSGCADTYIHSWDPTSNYGASTTLKVRTKSEASALVRFDLSGVPRDQTIRHAGLAFYVSGRSADALMYARAYDAYRPWVDKEATWRQAAAGTPWSAAGAMDTTADRAPMYSGSAWLAREFTLPRWVELDVTDLARRWHAAPGTNLGVVVRGFSYAGVEYQFASAEFGTASQRPKLVLEMAGPATATPTGEVSPTPTWTPWPTRPLTPSPTRTQGPSPTATPSPSITPTPTHTPTITPTPTDTPSPTPSATPATVSLQDTTQGYAGTSDTYISLWTPGGNYSQAEEMLVRAQGVMRSLLRFDLTGLPGNALLYETRLHLYVGSRSNDNPLTIRPYAVLRDWVPEEATWWVARTGENWSEPGASAPGLDRAAQALSELATNSAQQWISFDLTQLAQQWVDDPSSNHGLVLVGGDERSVEVALAASDNDLEAFRPRLVLTYGLRAPTPTPTPSLTATPTQSPSPTPTWTRPATNTPTPSPTFTPTVTPTPTEPPRVVESYRLSEPLVIDGDLSDWGEFGMLALDADTADFVHWRHVPSPEDSSAILRSAWDDQMVYFAIEVRDDVLSADSSEIWRDDGIELGLDGANDGTGWAVDDHQLTLAVDGRLKDYGDLPPPGITMRLRYVRGGFHVELAVPVEELGGGPVAEGHVLGFTLGLHDDDDGGDWESYLIWEGDSTNDPSVGWGRLGLVGTSWPTPTPTVTPEASPTAEPQPVELVLQPGMAGYDGLTDSYMSGSSPGINFGGAAILSVAGAGSVKPLLRFEVPQLPAGAELQAAMLEVHVLQQMSAEPLLTDAYMVGGSWSEDWVTWNQADQGVPWTVSGCQGIGQDYYRPALSTDALFDSLSWYSWDVTEAVRAWLQAPEQNRGVLLWGQGEEGRRFNIASAENPYVELRPRLTIRYLPFPATSN